MQDYSIHPKPKRDYLEEINVLQDQLEQARHELMMLPIPVTMVRLVETIAKAIDAQSSINVNILNQLKEQQ